MLETRKLTPAGLSGPLGVMKPHRKEKKAMEIQGVSRNIVPGEQEWEAAAGSNNTPIGGNQADRPDSSPNRWEGAAERLGNIQCGPWGWGNALISWQPQGVSKGTEAWHQVNIRVSRLPELKMERSVTGVFLSRLLLMELCPKGS